MDWIELKHLLQRLISPYKNADIWMLEVIHMVKEEEEAQ